MFNYLTKQVIDILLPPRCFVSGDFVDEVGTLSPSVWKELHFITKPFCTRCAHIFDYDVEGRDVCMSCTQNPPDFDQARAAIRYDAFSKKLVLKFKYADHTHSAKALGNWMVTAGRDLFEESDLLIPVPLHPLRLFQRRYNQATLLARQISRATHIKLENRILKRAVNTQSQGKKSTKDRQKNVKDAFVIDEKKKTALRDKTVILVDDVLTSGATMNECAKVLKKAGAKKVSVLCLARAQK